MSEIHDDDLLKDVIPELTARKAVQVYLLYQLTAVSFVL